MQGGGARLKGGMKEKSKAISFAYPTYDALDADAADVTALYLRVSTDSQAQDGYGLDVQYRELERYCRAYGIENAVVFVDDGYTGMNDRRPAFQALLKCMREKRVRLIVTHTLDRIGRTQMLILRFLKEECERAGCDFLALKDSIDSRSRQTYGILISILSIFAELDHDAIVSKLSSGRRQRAIEGHWKGGGRPPYGYYYSKELNTLAVQPEQALIVQRVFAMYNTMEYSPRKIADALGLSSDVVVFHILRNRVYLGEITYKGEQFRGLHQRLVDDETFARAQEILKRRSVKRHPSEYLLSSLVYCGVCGGKMRYMQYGQGKNRRLKLICYSQYASNAARNLVRDAHCDNDKYDAAEVEREVVRSVLSFAVRYHDELKERISAEEITAGLTRRAEEERSEYARLVKAYQRLGDESLLDEAERVRGKIRRTEREIAAEQERRETTKKMERRADLIRTLPALWKELGRLQRQNVMRALVERVELKYGTIKLQLKEGEFEEILAGQDGQ